MAHLPSPASASSSTLIVTSLPSKESLQTDAIDIYPSPHPPSHSPDQPARKMKPKPALTISTTPPNAMPVNEPKMSSKGFVEPHHGHLPRRSRKGTKADASAKVDEGKEKEKPELSRGLTTSTVQDVAAAGAVTSPVPVSATTAAPLLPKTPTPETSAAAAPPPPAPEGEGLEDDLLSYSPPKTPPPPQHPYIPRHELLPPTYLTSLRLPSTPAPASLASSSGPLVSTPAPVHSLASAAANVNVNSPAFATPGSGRATPNLPRRRVSRKTQGRRPSEGQVLVVASAQVQVEETLLPPGRRGHIREAADDGGGGGVFDGADDNVGSTSSQTSASPSASAGLGADDDVANDPSRSRSCSRTHIRTQPRQSSPSPAPLRLRARSQSRPRLTRTRHLSALGEDDDDRGELGASTPTSARLFVGQVQSRSRSQSQRSGPLPSVRSRGVSLPRLRLGESPLRSSFAGAGDHDPADDVFGEQRLVEVAKKTRRKEKMKERMCLQEVGRASGVEVGFLDVGVGGEDGAREAVVEFWNLKAGGDIKREVKRRVVLRVVDPLPSNSLGEGDPSSSSSSSLPQDLDLELPLPDDLPTYIDGQPALSAEQIRAGCAFIAAHLSSPPVSSPSSSSLPPSSSTSTRTTRRKVRILTPVARPEDGMAIALCYLAYYAPPPSSSSSSSDSSKTKTKTQSTLLESLHNYFRDPSDADTDIAFSINTDADEQPAQEDNDNTMGLKPWYESLSGAHLLYMRLLDEVEPRSEVRDPRVRETSRAFVPGPAYEEEVDVVGDSEEESSDMKTRRDGEGDGEEYAGIRTEWRGVLSYEGLVKVDEAGRGRDVDVDHGDVEVNGEEED
ncbi:hypothetical protein CVT26_015436 [Gymnopilus dilepis]|uniref:Uncharacterized protein n=1 Tax=Gymnopilus dilepis TaxID=231916 RepID=A0A409YEI5_9AGAR|nr:hypothetical protein CVT26_015436 [Gymnopilus dilepis]